MSGASALNRIMRERIPGFDELLDVATRLHQAQHGRGDRPDPMLQDMLDKLRAGRDKMANAIRTGNLANGVLTLNTGGEFFVSIRAGKGDCAEAQDAECPILPDASSPSAPEDSRFALLGTMTDSALARLWGVSHTAVAKMRKRRGIKSYAEKTRINWAKWDARIKGADMSAEGLAGLIGCDVSTVRERKRYLEGRTGKYGKPGRPLKGNEIDWSSVDWSLSNAEIARQLDISNQAVHARRGKLA